MNMPESSSKKDTQPAQLPAIGIALFVVFLWATSWVLIKIGLEDIPAITFAGLRYFLAFICLLPFAVRLQMRPSSAKITRGMWVSLILLGILLYALTQGAVFLSLAYLPAVTTNLLWSFSSVTVALFGIAWLAEYPTRFQWLGITLATVGAVIYFYPVALPSGYLIGILVALVGVISNAGASILGRSINRSRQMHPMVVTAVSMGIGAVVLLVAGIVFQGLPTIGLKGWLIITWLAVVNTAVAFTLWNYTLQTLTATESSIINGTMLIWIPILAVIFLDEQVTGKELLGLVAAGIGTLIVQLRSPSSLLRNFQRRIRR
jgi:drug/metabolite transporter (DMT)-like permease